MSEKTTSELETELSACAILQDYLTENNCVQDCDDVAQQLTALLHDSGLTRSELISRSNVNDIYVHQILSGKRRPSRDKLLCLLFALELTAEQVQSVLKRCGYAPLYAKNRRDSVILHGLYHTLPLLSVNESLYELGEPLLV